MPTNFACPCGALLAVPDEYVGRPVRCAACGAVSTVIPPPPVPAPPPRFVNGRPVVDEPPQPPASEPANAFNFTSPGEQAKERNREIQEQEQAKSAGGSLEGRMLGSGAAGGAVLMLVAAVWFVIGLSEDVIFFYPPVLFVIGLVAFARGLLAK